MTRPATLGTNGRLTSRRCNNMHSACIESLLESSAPADTPAASSARSSPATRPCSSPSPRRTSSVAHARVLAARTSALSPTTTRRWPTPSSSFRRCRTARRRRGSSGFSGAGARVVDLSSDLRPGNGAAAVPYGLTEVTRTQLPDADVVANPGCYPTAILMGLLPLARRGLIAPGATVTANAASGVTGAGLSPRTDLLFGEVTEDFKAYGVGNTHRHLAGDALGARDDRRRR